MKVTNWVIPLTRTADVFTPPTATPYPRAGADDVYEDVVVKVIFSEPVTGVDATTVTLTDAQGTVVPASVAQIGDYTWGLFPHQVFRTRGKTYTSPGRRLRCVTLLRTVWRRRSRGALSSRAPPGVAEPRAGPAPLRLPD